MTYDRYYYSILSDADKQVYKKIYDGILAFEPHISLPDSETAPEVILEYIGLDNPHIFYADFSRCSICKSVFGKSIDITYWYTQAEFDELNGKVNNVLKKMLSRVCGKSDYEKELSVHDLLIENISYDFSALENLRKHSPRSNSILGVLFYKTAVCEGVAKVYKMLLNMLDIKCIVAVGTESKHRVPHAWNIVKIEGEAYHTDVTWDIDTSKTFRKYDYFNLTDADIVIDHSPKIRYPVCNCAKYNYFARNGYIARTPEDAQICLEQAEKAGKQYVSLKLDCEYSAFSRYVKEIIDYALSHGLIKGNVCRYSYNTEQQIVTVNF